MAPKTRRIVGAQMWAYLIIYFIPLAVLGRECKEGWTYFNDFCYKHFDNVNDRVNQAQAGQRCASHGAILTPVPDEATVNFLGNLTKMPGHGQFDWYDHPVVGIRRDAYEVAGWYTEFDRSKPVPLMKIFYPYDYRGLCMLMISNKIIHSVPIGTPVPSLVPADCTYEYSRYICRMARNPVECTTPNMEKVNGQCVCERGYVDITETKDGKNYKKGEKCVAVETPSPPSQCEKGWTYYNDHCYKHFYDVNDRVNVDEAGQKCKQHGAILTPVYDQAMVTFLGNLSKWPGNGWYDWYEQPLIGMRRDVATYTGWYNEYDRSRPPPMDNMHYGLGNYPIYMCALLSLENVIYNGKLAYAWSPAVLAPTQCSYKFSRYICQKAKGYYVGCNKPHTESVNGKCICKTGYIDITETDVPGRKKYQQGEKCINKDPCREADDLTVTFIVDSSESIGAKNWDSLVEFLRSGAKFLPNTTRIGFVKYSDNVTFADFLPAGWSEKKFHNFVPSTYDNAGTNTAEALDKARKMLDKESGKNKVAILITDGLPFVDGLEQEEVLKKTEKAAEKLRSKGINLIALGYGESLYKSSGYQYIEKWLEDPEEDYFGYDKLACDFKQMHMSILMRKVCRRYVKDD